MDPLPEQGSGTGVIVLRPLVPGDAPAARDIYNHYVVHSTATYHVAPLDPAAMGELLFGDGPRCAPLGVFDADGVLLGFGSVRRYSPREAYDATGVAMVYLAPGATGRGLGRRLLARLEDQAARNGFEVILALVCTENVASMTLFRKTGYEVAGILKGVGRKFGRRLDTAILQKDLGHPGTGAPGG